MSQRQEWEFRKQSDWGEQSFQTVVHSSEGWSRRHFLKISPLGLLEHPLGETEDHHPDPDLTSRDVPQKMLSSGPWFRGF